MDKRAAKLTDAELAAAYERLYAIGAIEVGAQAKAAREFLTLSAGELADLYQVCPTQALITAMRVFYLRCGEVPYIDHDEWFGVDEPFRGYIQAHKLLYWINRND